MTHFGHKNILRFCKRPWDTVEEMDEGLIQNWNRVVGKDDIVFHLGDFAFAPNSQWKKLIDRLNGHIHLILGNHDVVRWPGDKIMELFDGVYQQIILKIDERTVYLNHFPFLCFAHSNPYLYGDNYAINLFGHVHSGPLSKGDDIGRLQYLFPTQYDVGVDNNNFFPVSWTQVESIINKQIEELGWE